MGGDGGVIASDRRYMRGAGSACHTADSARASAADRAEAEKDAQIQAMQLCAVTGSRLDYKNSSGNSSSGSGSGGSSSSAIVACPLGRLYGREAAVQALLRRMEDKNTNTNSNSNHNHNGSTVMDLGWQVRGLKDLHPARFQIIQKQKKLQGEEEVTVHVPICPVTSVELNGLQPAYLIVKTKIKKKKDTSKSKVETEREEGQDGDGPNVNVNVLSEKAIKEMGMEALQEEYGPFEKDNMIRLAPLPKMMSDIESKLREKRLMEKMNKQSKSKSKSSKKKRKKDNKNERLILLQDDSDGKMNGKKRQKSITNDINKGSSTSASASTSTSVGGTAKTVNDVRHNVAAAVAKSSVLSGLFSNNQQSNLSDKEKKD